MVYTKRGPFVDASPTGPYIDAGYHNAVEAALVQATTPLLAPAPSGGDDTAAIQPLVNAAAATNGTLQLQAGVYQMNITTPGGTVQPIIAGFGKRTTVLAFDASKPVFKFVGTSGAMGRGGLRSLGLGPQSSTSGGVALMYAGCCGVNSTDVTIDGGFDEGVVFHNELANSFTEFCTFEGSIYNTTTPVHYKKGAGNASFHGSGIVGNTIIGLRSGTTTPCVLIDSGGFPYNAPFSATVFLNTAGQPIFLNNTAPGTYFPNFYGDLRMENQGGSNSIIGTGNNTIYYQGTVSLLDGPGFVLGNLYLVDKVQFLGTAVLPIYRPHQFATALGSSPTKVTNTPNVVSGSQHLMSVHIRAAGGVYDYAHLVLCRFDHGGIVGSATVLATTSTVQDASHAWGAVTFSWSSGLMVSNANFPNDGSVTAFVGVTPLGGGVNVNALHQ